MKRLKASLVRLESPPSQKGAYLMSDQLIYPNHYPHGHPHEELNQRNAHYSLDDSRQRYGWLLDVLEGSGKGFIRVLRPKNLFNHTSYQQVKQHQGLMLYL